jgi:hypothetical protein
MARRLPPDDDDFSLPKVPVDAYPALTPSGFPKLGANPGPAFGDWLLYLRRRNLNPRKVAEADADFQAWHDANCTGCHFGTEQMDFVPGEHESH